MNKRAQILAVLLAVFAWGCSQTAMAQQPGDPMLVQRLDTWGDFIGGYWHLTVTAGVLTSDRTFTPLPPAQQFQLLVGGPQDDRSFGGFLVLGSYYYFGAWETFSLMEAAWPWATFTPAPGFGPNKNGHWRVGFRPGTGSPEIVVEQPAGNSLIDDSQTPVTFPTVTVGNNTSLTFTIKNIGGANLTGLTITKDGANPADFTVTQNPVAPVSGPSGSTTFIVRFSPSASGTRTATIHIASNDADENPFDIRLNGMGQSGAVTPEIVVEQPAGNSLIDDSQTPVTFPSVTVGNNASLTFTIKNIGGPNLTGLTITKDGANSFDFTITQNPVAPVSGPNGSTTFIVRFSPSASGTRTATIHIASNDADENPFDIRLSGEGELGPMPEIDVAGNGTNIVDNDSTPSPADLTDFGSVAVSGGTVTHAFTINNTGTGVLTLGSVTLAGAHAADFSVVSQPEASVNPGGLTIFEVSFNPSAAGSRFATLSFAANDSNENPFNFSIQGSANASGIDPLDANIAGSSVYVYATAIQADGKIIIGGTFDSVAGVPRRNVARLNADGTLDLGFDPSPSSSVYSIAVQSDGKILLGGSFLSLRPNGASTSTLRNKIARVNVSGTLDATFDPKANGHVRAMAVQSDGKILIGGQFTTLQPNGASTATARQYVARVNASGALDSTFDPKADDMVLSIGLQRDGQILLGGAFTTLQPNGTPFSVDRQFVARLNTNGTVDATFDPKPNDWVSCVATQPDGKILIGGFFTTLQPNSSATIPRRYIARVNSDATLDSTFAAETDDGVQTLAIQADGKIVLGGFFTGVQWTDAFIEQREFIAKLNADGSLAGRTDSPSANGLVRTVAIQADGKILLGGDFTGVRTRNGGSIVTRQSLARFDNDEPFQRLDPINSSQALWQRAGSAPDVSEVTFEMSLDGSTFTTLGRGTRIASSSNWQLTGLSLPGNGTLRARGRTANSAQASGIVEQLTALSPIQSIPDIAVDELFGTSLVDGVTITNFGAANPGSGSTTKTFIVRNTGTANLVGLSLSKSGVNQGDYTITGPGSTTLAPGFSTTFTVSFAPAAVGERNASLQLSSNVTGSKSPFDILLRGTGSVAPTRIIQLSGDLAFGDVFPGSGLQRVLTIANTGNSTLTVTGIVCPPGFSGNWSGVIGPGLSQEVNITFGPTAATSYGGTVVVNSDKTSGTNTIAVSGTGNPTATRVIALSGDLAFGSVSAGQTAQRTLTIVNTGNSLLTVTGITYPVGFSGNWSGAIGGGSSQQVSVTFAPTAAISYGGTIVVSSDKTSGTNTIAASGTGSATPPRIITLSGDLAFGNVSVGDFALRTLVIANAGNSPLTVSGISCPNGFSGSWSGTLAVGDSHVLNIMFSPTEPIAYGGEVVVSSDATSGPARIPVSGTGLALGGNDNFESAFSLQGGQSAGTNTSATRESGEPNHAGSLGGRSVWWTWTAPLSGPVVMNTVGSSFDTVLAVYTGSSVDALASVASDENHGWYNTSALGFYAAEGTIYRIAVDGSSVGDSGSILLNVAYAPIETQPDVLVGFGASRMVGENSYNTDASSQTQSATVRRKRTKTCLFEIQNDGSQRQTIVLAGSGSYAGRFKVKYIYKRKNITNQVTGGYWRFEDVLPGGSRIIKAVVTVDRHASEGEFDIDLIARVDSSPFAADLARFTVRVK